MEQTKVCTKCGEGKKTKYFEEFSARGKKYHRGYCIDCMAIKKGVYYMQNKEWILTDRKAYRLKNKEVIKNKDRQYQHKNKANIKTRRGKFYEQNKEEIKNKVAAFKKAHREYYNEWNKRWTQKQLAQNPNYNNNRQKKAIDSMKPHYIRFLLKRSGWPEKFITEDLISIYSSILKYKRHVKNKSKTS